MARGERVGGDTRTGGRGAAGAGPDPGRRRSAGRGGHAEVGAGGRGAVGAAARRPFGDGRPGVGAGQGVGRPGRRPGTGRRVLRKRRPRTAVGAAARGRRGAPPGRRAALGGRPAARRDPAARGAATDRGGLHLSVPAGRAAPGLHPGGADGGGDGAAGRRPGAAGAARRAPVLPDQRRYGHGQDDVAERAARAGGAGGADRPGRGLRRA